LESWSGTDADGWLKFSGADEFLGFDSAFMNGFRWSDSGLKIGTTRPEKGELRWPTATIRSTTVPIGSPPASSTGRPVARLR